MKIAFLTIKGLENVALEEITALVGVIPLDVSDKLVLVDYSGPMAPLTNLKTVDDVILVVSDAYPVHSTENFASVLKTAVSAIGKDRTITTTFSITSSIAKTDQTPESVVSTLSELLTSLGYLYTPTDRSNLDFRVFINDTTSFVGVRLTKEPLHKRNYEKEPYIGALKPTIAASLVFETTKNLPSALRIVDSFCGSGTILCESYLKGYKVFGGDINSNAISITSKRLKMLGCDQVDNLRLGDATKTKWNSHYFDCAISNLPWDKQHKISSLTDLYSKTLQEYKRILKPDFRFCILCHEPDLLIKHIKLVFGKVPIKTINVGYLGQTPTIVMASNGNI